MSEDHHRHNDRRRDDHQDDRRRDEKRPSRSTKTRVVYYDKSDSESDVDSDHGFQRTNHLVKISVNDDDRKLPARREVPCASLPVDEDERSDRIKIICDPTMTLAKIPTTSDEDTASLFLSSSVAEQSDAPATFVTKMKGKKKAKKKSKKKAISLLSVAGARITEEQLSAQDPSNIPEDWKTPGKYHPVCVAIWMAWLIFVPVFLDKQTIDGSVLHLVPPLLPWDAPYGDNVAALLMHYMPSQLTNSVKGDLHPACAKRSDGSLRSDCWEIVRQSVGEELYEKLLKMNFSPHAHPHNGKRTDIFSMEDSLAIMESYQVFLLFVFNTVARTHLCSQAVQNQVTALYGGEDSIPRIRQGSSGQVLLCSGRFFSDVLSS